MKRVTAILFFFCCAVTGQEEGKIRVTRLGASLRIGRLITLGSVLKMTDVAQIFWLHRYFFSQYQLCMNFDKKLFGLHFGYFFTNSSGHPEGNLSSGHGDQMIMEKSPKIWPNPLCMKIIL
jgi:hypothetical protein